MPKFVYPGGVGLIPLAGLLGAVAALYDYFSPATGIDHTGGVALVLASCILMVLAALAVSTMIQSSFTGILVFLIFLDVLGTGTAAWFLESGLVMAAMAIAALGLLFRVKNHWISQ